MQFEDRHIVCSQPSDPEIIITWNSSRQENKLLTELIHRRKELGLSQIDLSKLTGYRQQIISKVERNESSLTLRLLCKIADALNCDIELIPRNKP